MFIELTLANVPNPSPICVNFDRVSSFRANAVSGTNLATDDGDRTVVEPPDYILSMIDGRRRCSPVGEMHQAAYDIVHDIVTRHGITSPNQFTCRHIAKLAELVGYFPTRS